MTFPEDPLQGLSQLTGRQREVLQLVCDGLTYKDIAAMLVVAEATIKAHMGNIYQKLGLDMLPPGQRRKVIYEVCCPAMNDVSPTPVDTSVEPEAVPDRVARMVEEDERAIVPWQPAPLVAPTESIEVRPRTIRAIRLRWMVFGMILGAILVFGFILAFGNFLLPEPEVIMSEPEVMVTVIEKLVDVPVEVTVEVPVEVEKTVVVTAEPGPTSPPEIVEVVVTATSLPTAISTPTLTEPPITPPETLLELGEWWKGDQVWIRANEAVIDTDGWIHIKLDYWNKTQSTIFFEWSPPKNFTLVDNTGHHYEIQWQSQGDYQAAIEADELKMLSTGYGASVAYFDRQYFNASVTDLTFTVTDLSRISFAQWHIPLNK